MNGKEKAATRDAQYQLAVVLERGAPDVDGHGSEAQGLSDEYSQSGKMKHVCNLIF
jgi:hypothetical protein